MLKQIEYKLRTGRKYFFLYDDEKLTESEARFIIKSEGFSDFGFTLTEEQFNVLRKYLTWREEYKDKE